MTTEHTEPGATTPVPPLSEEQQVAAFKSVALIVLARATRASAERTSDGVPGDLVLTEATLDGRRLAGCQPAVAAMAAIMPLTGDEYRGCLPGAHPAVWLADKVLGLGQFFSTDEDSQPGGVAEGAPHQDG